MDLDVNLPFGAFAASKRSPQSLDHSVTPSGTTHVEGYHYDGLTPLTVAAQLTTIDVLDIIRLLQKHGWMGRDFSDLCIMHIV